VIGGAGGLVPTIVRVFFRGVFFLVRKKAFMHKAMERKTWTSQACRAGVVREIGPGT
jgi:hypothetical protein